MIILGVDPGSSVTGYGVVEYVDRNCGLIDCGCVRTTAKLPFPERLKKIYAGIMELIAEQSPDEIAVEDVFYSDNVKAALKIGHTRGVILLAAANSNIPVAEYSPREVKLAVVGSGSASKDQVQFMVKNILRLGEIPQPHDAADALAVALCHAHSVGSRR